MVVVVVRVSSGIGGGTRGGSIQPRVATVTLRNGSKPMALIGLPNVPPLFLEHPRIPSIQSRSPTYHDSRAHRCDTGMCRAIRSIGRLVYTQLVDSHLLISYLRYRLSIASGCVTVIGIPDTEREIFSNLSDRSDPSFER